MPARTRNWKSTTAIFEELIYVIQKGDTLYALAKKFGVKFSDILKLNGLSEKTPLKIGQILKIPQGKSQGSDKEQKSNSAQTDKQNKISTTKATSDKNSQAVKPSTSTKQAEFNNDYTNIFRHSHNYFANIFCLTFLFCFIF